MHQYNVFPCPYLFVLLLLLLLLFVVHPSTRRRVASARSPDRREWTVLTFAALSDAAFAIVSLCCVT